MEKTKEKRAKRRLEKLLQKKIDKPQRINLVHVSDEQPGITRIKKGDTFIYQQNGKTISDKSTTDRIRRLVIPPAWENVWICKSPNGHLQATGTDTKGRKQYKYHPAWEQLRNHNKFAHLYDFGKVLPLIRAQMKKDMALKNLCIEKVLATVVSLMQCTCIRIGSNAYEKMYGSYGLTTLKDRHVKINGSTMKFSFIGKKGVHQDMSLKSRKLAKTVQQCRDIPGQELFQYYDEDGNRKPIDSGMVNNYIRELSGGDFTAKDFRTWAGSLHAIQAFKEIGTSETINGTKKKIVEMLDIVSGHLGNTRAVCKKYYVHPAIIDYYTDKTLDRFWSSAEAIECNSDTTDLNEDEQVLMKILKANRAGLNINVR